jgi:primosomal protein N''
MTKDDDNKVVKLRQPRPKAAAGVVMSDDPIQPKSLLNMTDVEQDLFLQQLRERRLRAVEVLRQAEIARQQTANLTAQIRLQRKAQQVEKQLDKATKALDRLEELIYSMRALYLQHTDTDITKL